jgi:hypothetical protein
VLQPGIRSFHRLVHGLVHLFLMKVFFPG